MNGSDVMMLGIIPESSYHQLLSHGPWLLWTLALVALVILGAAADRAVWAAVRLAAQLGVSRIAIGATVVSLGTTAPEVSVSVIAAMKGQGGLALGNAIGSVICNTALIFGLGCVMAPFVFDRAGLRRQSSVHMGVMVLLVGIVLILAIVAGSVRDLRLSRGIGVLFMALLGIYMYLSIRWARKGLAEVETPELPDIADLRAHKIRQTVASFLVLAAGLAVVVVSSDALVGSVVTLSRHYGMPEEVLALTLVAFGTSVPELATAIASLRRGHGELMIGNILGANTLCILWVTGASAAVEPLGVPTTFFFLHLPVMVLVTGLLTAFIFLGGNHFRRWQGGLLLTVYTGYIAVLTLHAAGSQ